MSCTRTTKWYSFRVFTRGAATHTRGDKEFGIDIVSDDSKTIVHHKVSARVFLVMNENDLSVSQREFNRWYREAGENPMGRRGAKVSQGSTANGLNFEHVFNRLQVTLNNICMGNL